MIIDAFLSPARRAVAHPLLALSLMTLVACGREHAGEQTGEQTGQQAGEQASARTRASSDSTHAPADTALEWRVSARSVGAVTFGMTIAAAARVAGGTVARPPGGSCGFTSLRDVPHGARFMVSYDTVVRADVGTAAVATDRGARVGMSEDSVQHLYAGTLRVMPHKYVRGGHYLVSIPGAPADTMHQLIFETDGDRVTRYRAGLAPYVGYVEGCG